MENSEEDCIINKKKKKSSIRQPPPECSLVPDTANLTLPSSVTSCWIHAIKEVELMRPAIPKRKVAPLTSGLRSTKIKHTAHPSRQEARQRSRSPQHTHTHTATAPLLNLISSN